MTLKKKNPVKLNFCQMYSCVIINCMFHKKSFIIYNFSYLSVAESVSVQLKIPLFFLNCIKILFVSVNLHISSLFLKSNIHVFYYDFCCCVSPSYNLIRSCLLLINDKFPPKFMHIQSCICIFYPGN